MTEWKFDLDQHVIITESGKVGTVIGRAEYKYAEPGYLIRWKADCGRPVDSWWKERSLDAQPSRLHGKV